MKKSLLVLTMMCVAHCSFAQEAVNLGLRVKWANMNLGASSPTDEGNYYAWGETKTKDIYSWETYFDIAEMKPYPKFKELNIGTTIEASKYDAARMNWGGKWRMPTEEDWMELLDKCKITHGGKTLTVTGPNGNSIVIPVTGVIIESRKQYYTYSEPIYWTSRGWSNGGCQGAKFYSSYSPRNGGKYAIELVDMKRYIGLPIRPVMDYTDEELAQSEYERQKVIDDLGLNRSELGEDDGEIYDVAETMPQFIGDINTWISTHLKYPVIAEEWGIHGDVIVSAVIERDGSITDIKEVESPDPSLSLEAVRLVKAMPKWRPGTNNGIRVRVRTKIRVRFSL